MKRILLIVIIFLLFATQVHASLTLRYNQTQNTNGQALFNTTFSSAGNSTFYMNTPKNATVVNAKLNLSGYENLINTIKILSNYSFINETINISSSGTFPLTINSHINWLNTSNILRWGSRNTTFNTNTTFNITISNIGTKVLSIAVGAPVSSVNIKWMTFNLTLWNFTSNSWSSLKYYYNISFDILLYS